MCSKNGEEEECRRRPKLVVFDLDYTLWPFWVDTHVQPPFTTKGSKVVDAHGKRIKHYPEVPQVLQYLFEQGIPVAVASRTSEIQGANQLIGLFGWEKYFQYKEIYPGSKLNHFKVFAEKTGHAYSSMMFFDDEDRNIRDLRSVGAHCVLVNEGVDMTLFQKGLSDFANKSHTK